MHVDGRELENSDKNLYFYNVILSSDKRVIMKIVTSAQVMYYFTSA